jgi:hypothetical protein
MSSSVTAAVATMLARRRALGGWRSGIIDIPAPRREKLAVARQHPIAKQLEEQGATKDPLEIGDNAIETPAPNRQKWGFRGR